MADITPGSDNDTKHELLIKKDKSLLYMGLILGGIIIIMGYLTLFVDDPWKIFDKKEKVETVVDNKNDLEESAGMSDEDVRKSLTKFIEAFYNDQRRGYFDPPSYFAPITETFFNYHNLTYKEIKDIYWKKREDTQNLRRIWIVSSLDFTRLDSRITATYLAKEEFFKPSLNEQQSMDVKYEMIIDENGKIVSFKELEIRNFKAVKVVQDSTALTDSISAANANSDATTTGNQIYDFSVVDALPEYGGGQKEWNKYLTSNLKYPAKAREKNTQGKVYVGFIIDKDGSVRDVKVKQGIGDGCDEEAVRLVRSSGNWKPGQVAGNPVSTYYVLPVSFQLNH